eukprot:7382529-Prymnesium_polylepis.1
MYVLDAANFAAVSLWNGQLLTLYLYQLCGDTTLIGVGEAAQGVTRLLAAFPVGWLIDRRKNAAWRNVLICTSAVYGLAVHAWFVLLVVLPALQLHSGHEPGSGEQPYGPVIWLWVGSLPFFAINNALRVSVTSAVFADSVPTGGRVGPQAKRATAQKVGSLAAPVVQLVSFGLLVEDKWTEATLKPVMLVGLGLGGVASLLLLTLDQRRSLGAESEALAEPRPPNDSAAAASETTTVRPLPPIGATCINSAMGTSSTRESGAEPAAAATAESSSVAAAEAASGAGEEAA